MKKLLKKAWHALVTDEMAARRWARILLVGFGVSGVGAVPYAAEKWRLWLFLAASLAGCIGAAINLGQPNPTPEAVADAVKAVAARRSAGVIDPPPMSMPPGNPPPSSMTPGNP